MANRLDIISIGTLSRNRLWNESEAVRTPHATTTLIRTGKRNVLIDPGLPAAALGARLFERTGLTPGKIDVVFLTNFRPSHRAGIELFPKARLLIGEIEQQTVRNQLEADIEQADDENAAEMQRDLQLLEKFEPAPDKLAEGIDLFPLPGFTPGTAALLSTTAATATLIAGDAVPTLDHFLAMQVLPECNDIRQAQESMREVYEIADLVVPGHDNLFVNPRSQGI
jgi:glyoxylase-like metal-dependent hydrolase (beta-lactamase superfamily II)